MNVYLLKRSTQTLTKVTWATLVALGYSKVGYTTSLSTNRYYRDYGTAYVDAEKGLFTARNVDRRLVTTHGIPMIVNSLEPKDFVTLHSPLNYSKEAETVFVTAEANLREDFDWLTGTTEGLELIKKTFPANRYGVEVFVKGWNREYNYMSEEDLKLNDFVQVTTSNSDHKYGMVTNTYGLIYNDVLNEAGFYSFNRSSSLMQTAIKYDIDYYNLKKSFYDHDFDYPYVEKDDLKIYRVFPVTVNGEKWVIYNDVNAFNKKIAELKLAYVTKDDEFKEILMHFLYHNYEDGRRGFNDEKEFITYGLTEYYRLGNPDTANATAIVISF